jgi:hypothetical protein
MIPHSLWRVRLGRIVALAWLTASLAALPGCHVLMPAEPAEPVASYARGDLEGSVTSDFGKVIEATKGALGDLSFGLTSETQDATRTVLLSRTPGDKKIEVEIRKSGNSLIGIKIRVGVFGDEQVSRKIFDRIKTRL